VHNDVAPFRRSVDQRERRPLAEEDHGVRSGAGSKKRRPHEKLSTCCSSKIGKRGLVDAKSKDRERNKISSGIEVTAEALWRLLKCEPKNQGTTIWTKAKN